MLLLVQPPLLLPVGESWKMLRECRLAAVDWERMCAVKLSCALRWQAGERMADAWGICSVGRERCLAYAPRLRALPCCGSFPSPSAIVILPRCGRASRARKRASSHLAARPHPYTIYATSVFQNNPTPTPSGRSAKLLSHGRFTP
jgi:hypothetical protein